MIDPTTVRLSRHFLLSDFMGSHSVYTKAGHANIFDDPDGSKLAEGVCLAENVFEQIVEESPVSISYGYISLELARKIVKYQSPEKPSYHQWNDGAAADVIVHNTDAEDVPPMFVARAFDDTYPMSRTITYSESPFICVATRVKEVEEEKPRKAFYENRFTGVRKPKFLKVWDNREAYFNKHSAAMERNWRGAGYPSYHGGGIRQMHHIRVGRYSMFSDFLYSTEAVQQGYANYPPADANWHVHFIQAGKVYSDIIDATAADSRIQTNRLSIVRAYESPSWSSDERFHWKRGFALEFIAPDHIDPNHIARLAGSHEAVNAVGVDNHTGRISVSGLWQ